MRYIVVVNQNFLVTVDANSALSAEHKILDNYGGIAGAQAFDRKAMKTDTFTWFMENGETISLSELEAKCASYGKALGNEADERNAVDAAERKIKELEAALEDAKKKLAEEKKMLVIAEAARKAIEVQLNIR